MIISHKYKFIFIKTRKTAGTSLELYLSKICGIEDVVTPIKEGGNNPRNYNGLFNPLPEVIKYANVVNPNNYHYRLYSSNPIKDYLKKRKFYNHIPAYQVKERISADIWQNYYKFCFDRNPWDKTISHYYFMKADTGKNFSFDNYLSQNYLAWNYPLYTNPFNPNEIIVDYVGKYDNLNQELNNIFDKLKIPLDGNLDIRLKGNIRKDKRPYQYSYNSNNQALISEKFSHEILLHNFKYD